MHVEILRAVLGSSLSCPQMDLMQALLEESSLGERSNSAPSRSRGKKPAFRERIQGQFGHFESRDA